MAATYVKLDTGSWGVRVDFKACEGMAIDVAKRDGSVSRARLGRMVQSRAGVSVFEIKKADTSAYHAMDVANAPRAHTCEQCGKQGHEFKLALDINGIKGRVCPACAQLAAADRSFG